MYPETCITTTWCLVHNEGMGPGFGPTVGSPMAGASALATLGGGGGDFSIIKQSCGQGVSF